MSKRILLVDDKSGVYAILTKPLKTDKLLELIASALSARPAKS